MSRERFDLMECPRCETLFQSPLPTDQDFRQMYADGHQLSIADFMDTAKVRPILDYYTNCVNMMRSTHEGAHRYWK